jgi:hypothetical protein
MTTETTGDLSSIATGVGPTPTGDGVSSDTANVFSHTPLSEFSYSVIAIYMTLSCKYIFIISCLAISFITFVDDITIIMVSW